MLVLMLSWPLRAEPVLPSDAYIWQRKWTPSLVDALQSSNPLIRQWRVLVADVDRYGWPAMAEPDLALLARTGRPVMMVVRIEGQAAGHNVARLVRTIPSMAADWRRAGVALRGVEIDHDAGTARLAAYADFLAELRGILPTDLVLSITALPTWLGSPLLEPLLKSADESVLQVHAVLDPMRGLFDPAQAKAWIEAFARRTPRPWSLALPAYGTRVSWNNDGRMIAVESERPVPVEGAASRELVVVPQVIAGFLRDLDQNPPARLAAVAWFRLPTADDTRAWSLPAWQAVVRREALRSAMTAVLRPAEAAGLFDIVLANAGNIDDRLPLQIYLPVGCAADGINGYAIGSDRAGTMLVRRQDGLLRVGRERRIGWLRCEGDAPVVKLQR